VNPARSPIRCAIYTRKSSEEGLEQSFNSLHAQREACEAYVLSQRHEGWQLLAAKYDDGGFSGGNMERPGLRKLLDDIASKKIDTVVVYKVDRLTRALSDFARIVETFDRQGVSFVSVTQQFNTTTSMGRLTLNVLLSFAQFEREVTGERIRDKVAASKKKGMWMGGHVPKGYDWIDRQLVINLEEAESVRKIFLGYLKSGCVRRLCEDLRDSGIRSKEWISSTGRRRGGVILSRGSLYHTLNNPIYIGKVAYQGVLHDGQHEPIVDFEVWTQVAGLLKENQVTRRSERNLPSDRLLHGKLATTDGQSYTPTHASKKGRRYFYYILNVQPDRASVNAIKRVPALEIEQLVASRVRSLLATQLELTDHFSSLAVREMRLLIAAGQHRAELLVDLSSPETTRILRSILKRVVLTESEARIELDRHALTLELLGQESAPQDLREGECIFLNCPFALARRGQQVRIVISAGDLNGSRPVPSLMKAIARSRDWAELIVSGRARTLDDLIKTSGLTRAYVKNAFRCVALSPPVIDAILSGRHRVDLTVMNLTNDLPIDWNKQQL
jgi:site-specific DNA recombinase